MADLPRQNTSSGQHLNAGTSAAPPSVEQVQAMHEELMLQEQLVLQSKLEEVRQKREQELTKGKPKKIEKINVEDLKFAREERKVGLPERIRKLPKDHPVRVLYEKGFNQRQERKHKYTLYRQTGIDLQDIREILRILIVMILIVAAVGGIFYESQKYQANTNETRQQILNTIKEKSYSPEHPKIAKKFNELYWSNWLPDLLKLLDFINGLGVNLEAFDGNPEPGSYTEYIKRHNKPFDQAEAMEWYAREMRKPSWMTNQ
ncbi:MAG: hypothetical protein H7839_01835 [Magnetococcus sp. YQC-5]